MKKQNVITLLLIVLLTVNISAQVAINTDGSDPNPSAMLDVKSTTGGLLIPRMTEQQIVNIVNPAQGLLVYDISNKYFVYYDSGKWNILKEGELPRFIIDADQDTRIHVEESPDEDIIRFDMEGTEYLVLQNGRIKTMNTGQSVFLGDGAGNSDDLSANQNVFVGYNAAYNTTSGEKNVAVGENAMFTNSSGENNTAIGYQTLQSNETTDKNVAVGAFSLKTNTGNDNTAIGTSSMFLNTNGSQNVATGNNALYANQTGSSNVASGFEALYTNTTGNSNVALGSRALYQNTSRGNLVAIGDSALYKNGTGATQSYEATNNTAVGSKALFDNKQGYSNTAIGSRAMINNDDGWKNTALGAYAMNGNNSGSRNTAIGSEALYNNNSGSYNTAVGQSVLHNNTESYNTGLGAEALQNNTNGAFNTANGYHALQLNEGGSENTATGANALMKNISGANAAFGTNALLNNTEGSQNTAMGMNALLSNEGGTQNTAIGFNADVLDNGFTNATAIGFDAKVGQSDAITIGNADVKVGLAGVSNPTEKLEVPGAVKIGNTDNPNPTAGTIRWNQELESFEGYTGTEWVFLDRNNRKWSEPYVVYQDEIISAQDGASGDKLGTSISLSGVFLIAGAPHHNNNGAAYVYTLSGNDWVQETKLIASDGYADDKFGISVSISGQYALVGASNNDGKGAAYVFYRDSWSDTWLQQAKLVASDGVSGDDFGFSVSISGEYAIIGAPLDDDGTEHNKGSVYFFKRNGTTWSQESKVSETHSMANYGYSVFINDIYAIVGAPREGSSVSTQGRGKLFIYELNGGTWNEEEELVASDWTQYDHFGEAVSIGDNYAIVGAPNYQTNTSNANEGAAYILKRSGSSWSEQARINASDGGQHGGFGESVFINDEYAVVGAPGNSSKAGAAYIFSGSNSNWSELAKLSSSSESFLSEFGCSVLIQSSYNNTDVFVGAKNHGVAGEIFIFQK